MPNIPLKLIHNNILARLRSQITVVNEKAIVTFPDATGPDGDVQVINPAGMIFLHYNGTGWKDPKERLTMTQTGDGSWIVTVVSRSYIDGDGALDMIDQVCDALVGYNPYDDNDVKRLYLVRDGFLKKDAGLWWYFVELKAMRLRAKI